MDFGGWDNIDNKVLRSPKGDRGEIAAAAWFGYTLDELRKPQSKEEYDAENINLSREIGVLELISALCPRYTIKPEIKEALREWSVNVTHFCRVGYSPGRDILPLCWKRHVGLYMPEGEEGVDFVITCCTSANPAEANAYATMRVQVKNFKNTISECSKDAFFQKLDVRRCAPISTSEEEPLSIAFLVQVGKGTMRSSVALEELGRRTRQSSSESLARQVQVACSLTSRSDEEADFGEKLRKIPGDEEDNTEFTWPSEHFIGGELVPGSVEKKGTDC